MLLQGVAPQRDVLLVAGHVLVRPSTRAICASRRAVRMRCELMMAVAVRGASFSLVHEDLRRVIVPAGIVEVIPGLEQAGFEGAGGGAAQPPRKEQVILPEPRVEVFEQGARLGQVPEFEAGGNAASAGGAVLDERGFRVAGLGGVGVEAINGAVRRPVAPGRGP